MKSVFNGAPLWAMIALWALLLLGTVAWHS